MARRQMAKREGAKASNPIANVAAGIRCSLQERNDRNWSHRPWLGKICSKYAVVEFVASNDKLVLSESQFFPAYYHLRDAFSLYSLERLYDPEKSFCRCRDSLLQPNRYALIC